MHILSAHHDDSLVSHLILSGYLNQEPSILSHNLEVCLDVGNESNALCAGSESLSFITHAQEHVPPPIGLLRKPRL